MRRLRRQPRLPRSRCRDRDQQHRGDQDRGAAARAPPPVADNVDNADHGASRIVRAHCRGPLLRASTVIMRPGRGLLAWSTASTNEKSPGRRPGDWFGSPDGIRTHATAVRGRRPRPLDDGARTKSVARLAADRIASIAQRATAAKLLGYQDSNLEWRYQKPLCCQLHHTPLAAYNRWSERYHPSVAGDCGLSGIGCGPTSTLSKISAVTPPPRSRAPPAVGSGCGRGPAVPATRTAEGSRRRRSPRPGSARRPSAA